MALFPNSGFNFTHPFEPAVKLNQHHPASNFEDCQRIAPDQTVQKSDHLCPIIDLILPLAIDPMANMLPFDLPPKYNSIIAIIAPTLRLE